VEHHPSGLISAQTKLGWSMSAEIPRLSVVIRYAAQNQCINGVFVLCRIVPAVSET
jgi:hypothetical protein